MHWKTVLSHYDLMFRRALAQRYSQALTQTTAGFQTAQEHRDLDAMAVYGERYAKLYDDAKTLEMSTLDSFLVREDRHLPLKFAGETVPLWERET